MQYLTNTKLTLGHSPSLFWGTVLGYENFSILCKLHTVLLDSLAVPTTRKKTYGAKAPNKLCCKSTKAVLTSKYRIIINKQDYHPIRSFDIDAHKIIVMIKYIMWCTTNCNQILHWSLTFHMFLYFKQIDM